MLILLAPGQFERAFEQLMLNAGFQAGQLMLHDDGCRWVGS